MIFSFDKHSFSSNKCRGVSHTPWCERKRNDGGEHIPIVRCAPSPMWRAYAIRPYSFTLSRDDAKTSWSNFKSKLYTTQKRLEVTSDLNCTLRKNGLKSLHAQIVHCTRPFLHRSMTFCTRRKTVMQTFKDLLYTCKTVMQTFNALLYTTQNCHANVQRPFVPCVKPLCKCSGPHCSWYKPI